jgi:hypothetical protein
VVRILLFWAIFVALLVTAQLLFRVRAIKSYLLFVIVIPYAWAFVAMSEHRPLSEVGLHRRGAVRAFLTGAAVAVGVQTAMNLAFWALGFLRLAGVNPDASTVDGIGQLLFRDPVASVAACLATGVAEELLFTGVTARIAWRSYGFTGGVLAWAGAVFLTHMGNPSAGIAFIPASICGGVLWVALYVATGSLWATIGLHALHNFLLGGILAYRVSGYSGVGLLRVNLSGPTWVTGGALGPEGGIVLPLLMLAVGISLRSRGQHRTHRITSHQPSSTPRVAVRRNR